MSILGYFIMNFNIIGINNTGPKKSDRRITKDPCF